MRYKRRVRKSRYGLNQTKFLQEDEWRNLEQVCKRGLSSAHDRNCIMLLLALRTGARASELLAIEKRDFFEARGTGEGKILIRGIKGSNDREIPVQNYLSRAISAYIKTIDGDRLFPISYAMLQRIWDFYRPTKKPFHSLRHTFGLNVYLTTRDIRMTQVALGHRNISNTMIYVDYAYSMQELKRIIF